MDSPGPSVYVAGTVDDTESQRRSDEMREGITPIYAKRTGLSDEKITELLEAETMLADKAVVSLFAG